MTLAEFIESHKDSPFKSGIDIEMVIASLTCNGRIDLAKIMEEHNKFKEKSRIGKLKKKLKNEIRNSFFTLN